MTALNELLDEFCRPEDEAPVLIITFVDRDGNVTSERREVLTMQRQPLPARIDVHMDLSGGQDAEAPVSRHRTGTT